MCVFVFLNNLCLFTSVSQDNNKCSPPGNISQAVVDMNVSLKTASSFALAR